MSSPEFLRVPRTFILVMVPEGLSHSLSFESAKYTMSFLFRLFGIVTSPRMRGASFSVGDRHRPMLYWPKPSQK